MKTALIIKKYGVAALCFALGLVLLTRQMPVKAAGDTYSVTWSASKYLVMQITGSIFGGEFASKPAVALGVSSWDVKGGTATTKFKENWNFTSEPKTQTEQVPTNTLAGVFGERGVYFSTLPVGSLAGPSAWTNVALGNGAIQCAGGDPDCLYSSGQYGYTLTEDVNHTASDLRSATAAGGAYIPLSWTIKGTMCDADSLAQCN